jgi:hypothetical protein
MVENTTRSNFHGIICSDYWIGISLQVGGAFIRTKILLTLATPLVTGDGDDTHGEMSVS